MNAIVQPERVTQDRVVALFRDELGYRHLGDWTDRTGNSHIEAGLLTDYLVEAGYSPAQIGRALDLLRQEANHYGRSLYDNNKETYRLLRYGVPLKTEAGGVNETVHLVDWNAPEKNHFALAEEVALHGAQANSHERRPDIVLYLNGIAIGMLELKNSRVTRCSTCWSPPTMPALCH